MNRLLTVLFLALWTGAALAATGLPAPLDSNASLRSKANLQRGARTFLNYCVSCHSAQFMRYSRMAADLELPEDVVIKNMMFTTDKIGDTMKVAMKPADAEAWFGVPPPDLSVIARSRGPDWLYSFLLGFYLDEKRPTGVNNLYFPQTAMPHVLSELQGLQKLVTHGEEGGEEEGGHGEHAGPTLELVQPGKQTPAEYAETVRDLVSFLVYVGEPAKLVRYKVGFWVIAFLVVLFIVTYLMKREYWRDVH
jgi:ubiquinol-cytochrome c reductase cytochrome c1 subunit